MIRPRLHNHSYEGCQTKRSHPKAAGNGVEAELHRPRIATYMIIALKRPSTSSEEDIALASAGEVIKRTLKDLDAAIALEAAVRRAAMASEMYTGRLLRC